MAALFLSVKQFGKSLIFSKSNRSISLSAITHLKQIIKKKEDNVLTIEAITVPHKKEHLLFKLESNACSLCATGLDVKHTDVLILNQFLRKNGTVLPRRITGLCKIQQNKVTTLVTMAKRAGLLPDRLPKEVMATEKWRKYNTYFDENTIRYKYKHKKCTT
ncbi:28S ribosomal protein S18a, mitochondrial [Trachymyrmex septentrionalis]|uniref:28S ribosomal protein S18a, mitochondrial n=1 Tax=Trachymyrmex septentrionalis TaxID=34720 RepID=A0A151JTF8_9HYME|nr:PREDICTED: 28S ribosomal protein S18a, mitochondrial [Trachymyrmex septentrionalis]KYN32769.1 28S ribosomal protein S18a, mitochondrial [Trachymyrmex septentrionalis]